MKVDDLHSPRKRKVGSLDGDLNFQADDFIKMGAHPFPKILRYHPVVGCGLNGDPGSIRSYTRFEAIVWLSGQPYTHWIGSKESPILDLTVGVHLYERPDVMLRWSKKYFRRFLQEIAKSGIITSQLLNYILNHAFGSKQRRQNAITTPTRRAEWSKTSGRCAYCAVHLTLDSSNPTSFEVDHVLAVTLGGSDDVANLIPACRSCNNSKRAGTALKFMGGVTE